VAEADRLCNAQHYERSEPRHFEREPRTEAGEVRLKIHKLRRQQQGWPFPGEPNSFVDRRYKVAECFVYHINAEEKIDLMREYLDAGSVWMRYRGTNKSAKES
jgi:hypothetical protein